MDYVSLAAAVIGGALTTLHLASAAISAWRCHPKTSRPSWTSETKLPPVSIIRPVCGIDNYAEETLASGFTLDHSDYELIFCVADEGDTVVPLVQRLMKRHPQTRARLLFGERWINANPKLNNMAKGFDAASHEWIVVADSNVLMPPDYLQRLLSAWRDNTGLVCSPPLACRPDGFWAEVECAFLNGYQARCQLAADATGFGFAQGKSMLWRREDLDSAGGMAALACDLAEDAASTKVVRGLGLKVRLTRAPFEQPLGHRSFVQTWRRQMRWAQLRRASFPFFYTLEALAGPALPLASIAWLASQAGVSILAATAGFTAFWYGAEILLTSLAGWYLSWRLLPAMIARDALLPLLWIAGWRANRFVWRGNAMTVERSALAH